ncbi:MULTISPECIES: hypothetical protein [unclassified Mesorhizobium]|uniref:hypothetical protein n=1 Tax=unclassified Mesorhizobium TaxID=325217 RepID=UPI000FCA4DAE|nr:MULTISPECIES: hypothetical protein [unclassified Mesorhizobium]TGP27956.1 hypothetical protein EN875_032880 [Mesorhizobium sp. M2D.F.Ca.ET.232.01.1.1]TGQ25546.1 hypothetical protein EN863_057090 [Mesorhizobium sp. M00.F.Ca.ET.220.01.1.1]TGT97838.1 hypothetical protein EN806_48525 [bacterium M00.F.Ca.ET.163.01.1.1]
MNASQKQFLAERSAATVNDLEPLQRLMWLEIDSSPDPVESGPEYTGAQLEWLATYRNDEEREAALADPFLRDIFDGMRSKKPTPEGTAAVAPKRTGPPMLSPRKLESLPPLRRAQLFEHAQVLAQDHREALAGIAPHLRESRWDIEAARLQAGPYLMD